MLSRVFLVGVCALFAARGHAGSKGDQFGGELGSNAPPPSLSDEGKAPSPEKALAAAKAFFAAVKTKRQEKVIPVLAIPYSQYIRAEGRGPGEDGCRNTERLVDEGEGMPGAPTCVIKAIGAEAQALADALVPEMVFPTLAALEAQGGVVPGPTRKLLRPLKRHTFVDARLAGDAALRVVLAVRGTPGERLVDAVLVVLPPKTK